MTSLQYDDQTISRLAQLATEKEDADQERLDQATNGGPRSLAETLQLMQREDDEEFDKAARDLRRIAPHDYMHLNRDWLLGALAALDKAPSTESTEGNQ